MVTGELFADAFFPTQPLPDDSVFYKCGEDLTVAVKDLTADDVVGREEALDQLIRILGRRTKANPVILGDAGVGKSSLVRCLAWRIVQNQVPKWLQGRKVIRTSFQQIHGAADSSTWEFNSYMRLLSRLLKEAVQTPVVLFFDEFHTIRWFEISSNVIKPYLADGRLKIIGATTTAEFHRLLGREDALVRRFQPVYILPPEGPVLERIVEAECRVLERHFGITARPQLARTAIRLADEYLPFRCQPDKAVDLLEGAFVLAGTTGQPTVGEQELRTAVAELTGIPDAGRVTGDEHADALEAELNRRVLGQEEAIAAICRRLQVTRNRVQLNPERPLAVFMCTGPSGVGKTELAKALASVYMGSEEHLIRIDMSVHKQLYSLLGRPGTPSPESPEYLPPLTLGLRSHPYGVLLLDEFEKADEEVWTAFLQAFDYGRMTDLQGNVLHLGSYIVLMTCNVGFDKREQWTRVRGFGPEPTSEAVRQFLTATKLKFPAEFLGRLDGVLVFRPLTSEMMTRFIDQKLLRLGELTRRRIVLDDAVRKLIRKQGFDPEYGARPLNRAFDQVVGTALARLRTKPEWETATAVRVSLVDGVPCAEVLESQAQPA